MELINLLRALMAVARFIVFAAKALHEHPEWRDRLANDEEALELFAQETRRISPFFPFIGGRVAKPFEWKGHSFHAGDWVLLDLYGTNRHPEAWDYPEALRPDQLRGEDLRTGFKFVPQGAGDPARTHRCPGDNAAVELIKSGLRVLTSAIDYTVPEQDLSVNLRRMPALPKSGFIISDVRLRTVAAKQRAASAA